MVVIGFRYVVNHSTISVLIAEWLTMYLIPTKAKTGACHAFRSTIVRNKLSDNIAELSISGAPVAEGIVILLEIRTHNGLHFSWI